MTGHGGMVVEVSGLPSAPPGHYYELWLLGSRRAVVGLSSFGVLAGSLVLKAFESSQNTTVAMVQRGYDGTMPMLDHRPFKHSEVTASLVLIIAAGFLWKI